MIIGVLYQTDNKNKLSFIILNIIFHLNNIIEYYIY